MGHWLQNFDRISFWLGFLAASLFWWLIKLLRPAVLRLSQNLRAGARITHQQHALADEVRIGNDVLRKAQGWHLAAALYSLDEVLVPPQFLAPPQLPDAYEPPQDDDITDRTIPYLVDDPELASFYHAPKLGLAESLQNGANLVIVGVPGSGKSVALASLACDQLRKQEYGKTPIRTPLLIHIGELGLPFGEDLNADETLLTAAAAFAVSVPKKRLPGVVHTLLKEERILLLLDGLDELVPAQLEDASRFLEGLLAAHPGIQIVTTAHLGNLGRLPSLGFQPLTLVNWGNTERHQLISRWAELWQIHTRSQSHKPTSEPDPLLVTGWLLNSSSALSPLELTLKVWGAFAGDSLGPDEGAVIEAHIRRMTFGQPARNRNGLEQLASQMILSMDPVPTRAAAELWLSGKQDTAPQTKSSEEVERQIGGGESTFAEVVRAAGALPDLLECGLLIPRSAESISLAHPIFTAYLASRRLRGGIVAGSLAAQPEWCGRTGALKYLAVFDQRAEWIAELLKCDDDNPLLEALFQAARWLPGSQEGSIWTDQVMRRLAICLQTERHPISLRFRALSALVQSKQPGVSLLLRQLAIQKEVESQQLAALGLGYLRDFKSIEILSRQSDHPNANLSKAALLALVAMGENTGLEAVGKILLRGDEAKSKDAADALANDIGEGRDFLLECTELENPNVRRAAVFGLGRTGDPKFEKVLETLSSDDNQWIVQDAAKQQLKQLHDVHPRSPARLPELPQTPWLIEFASDREVGVAPGKPAFQLLERAVIEGNRDQRLAAIYCLGISGNPAAAPPLVQAYAAGEEEILDAVYTGLWNLAACGISIYP